MAMAEETADDVHGTNAVPVFYLKSASEVENIPMMMVRFIFSSYWLHLLIKMANASTYDVCGNPCASVH